MRDEIAVAVGIFLIILIMIALLSYFGWDRWGEYP